MFAVHAIYFENREREGPRAESSVTYGSDGVITTNGEFRGVRGRPHRPLIWLKFHNQPESKENSHQVNANHAWVRKRSYR